MSRDVLLERFRVSLEAMGKTEMSIDRMCKAVRHYLRFCSASGLTPDSREAVEAFLAFKRREGCGAQYRRWLFAVLSSFFRRVGWEWPFSEGDRIPAEEPSRPFYTREEMERLIEASKNFGLREQALVRLSCTLGLRRIELHLLDKADYDPQTGILYVRTAKHGKRRRHHLDPETRKILEAYLATRRDKNPAMFKGRRGRLSLRMLNHILEQVRNEAGINKPRAGYHACRRGLVTQLHKLGATEKELQEWMGWKTPTMPHLYIQLTPHEVEQKIAKIHPLYPKTQKT